MKSAQTLTTQRALSLTSASSRHRTDEGDWHGDLHFETIRSIALLCRQAARKDGWLPERQLFGAKSARTTGSNGSTAGFADPECVDLNLPFASARKRAAARVRLPLGQELPVERGSFRATK
jgi:hypothetical protein